MMLSDAFVFSDDVKYTKRNFVNRVKISSGSVSRQWTLPVHRGRDERIADKIYIKERKTLDRLIRIARSDLCDLPHGRDVSELLDVLVDSYWHHETLADLNIAMIEAIARALGINTPTYRGTALGLGEYRATERLIKRLEVLNADTYLSGQGAGGYTDLELFAASGRKIVAIDYRLGPELLGDDLSYSILVGIGRQGLARIADGVSAFREKARRSTLGDG